MSRISNSSNGIAKEEVYKRVGNFLLVQSVLFAGITRIFGQSSSESLELKWVISLIGIAGAVLLIPYTRNPLNNLGREGVGEWIAVLSLSILFAVIWFFCLPMNQQMVINIMGDLIAKYVHYVIPVAILIIAIPILRVSKATGIALIILGASSFFIGML